LTSLRWFAALLVFVCHAGQRIDTRPIYPVLGYAGVGLFFVLSGIVLTWSAPDRDKARWFYRRRFARIYPATMAASAIAVLITVAGFGLGAVKSTIPGALAFVLLLQAWTPWIKGVAPYNGPVWTLSVEAFFYVAFPWLHAVMARIPQRRVVAGASVVVLVTVLVSAVVPRSVAMHLPLLRLSEFVAGMAVGIGLRRGWVPRIPLAPALVGYGALMITAMHVERPWLLMLPGAVAVLCAAAGADLRGEQSWLTRRFMVYLGQISFCFYLIHQAMLHGVWEAGLTGAAAPIALLLAFGAARALHHGVELPMQRLILGRRPARTSVVMAESAPASA
jgi:peptidoglycan/LPS O-acetylase OafA/YrhL